MKRHDKAPNGFFANGMMLYGNLEAGATVSQGFIIEAPDLQSASVSVRNEFQDKLRVFLATLGPKQRVQLQWICDSDYKEELLRYPRVGCSRTAAPNWNAFEKLNEVLFDLPDSKSWR